MDGINLKYTFIITVNLRTLTTMKSKARSVLSDSLPLSALCPRRLLCKRNPINNN